MDNPFKKLPKNKFPEKRATFSKGGPKIDRDKDVELFLQAVSDVKPLSKKGPEVVVKKSPPRAKNKDSALEKFLQGDFEFSVEYTGEYVQGSVKGVNLKILNKLKRGEFSVQAHLDLHGFTLDDANFALLDFVRNNYFQNKRCLLIVTGRGLNSPGGISLLKREVQFWLTRDPLKRIVLAFCSALPKHGGSGAIYVLLRKYKKTRGKILWDRWLYPEEG
ncbi:MAG: Smr/MutS family protein [Desulfonauticus sp.]|nr:Smr/MutS family protein [Desulfonauticus sp.]